MDWQGRERRADLEVIGRIVGAEACVNTLGMADPDWRTNVLERICSVVGCERPHHGIGWCRMHGERFRQHGSTDDPRPTTEERFRSKINCTGDDDQCHEWQGCRSVDGYGRFTWPSGSKHRQPENAHRIAWRLAFGPVPEGLCVLHRCDNPPCCRLDHLFLGTHADNARDRQSKGRGVQLLGETNPNAKLTDDAVREMRTLWESGVGQRVLARQFKVDPSLVSYVVRRKIWRHVA